jgi:hypothetical protein
MRNGNVIFIGLLHDPFAGRALDVPGCQRQLRESAAAIFRANHARGVSPAIIFEDGGAPIVVNSDGNLYYGSNPAEGGAMPPGGLTVSRMSTD